MNGQKVKIRCPENLKFLWNVSYQKTFWSINKQSSYNLPEIIVQQLINYSYSENLKYKFI